MLSESGTRYDWLPTQIQHHKDQNQDEHCVYQGFFLSKDLEASKGPEGSTNQAHLDLEIK